MSMAVRGVDGTTTAALRVINTRTVLERLRLSPNPATLSELARATGLTRPTVHGSLGELNLLGLTDEVAPTSNHQGRPARRYQFAAQAALAAGVDLRPDRVRVHVVDLLGRPVARCYQTHLDLDEPTAAVAAAAHCIATALDDADLDKTRLAALSIAVPGVVGPEGVLWKSVVVPRWVDVDLPGLISSAVPANLSVSVDNAANHAALSELSLRLADDHAPDADSSVFILVDEGIGAGIVLGGEVLRGSRGCAAEVGALDSLRWSTASANLLTRTSSPDLGILSTFPQSHGQLRQALIQFATDVAVGTSALVLAFDPEVVVFGGVLATVDDDYLDLIRTELATRCIYPPKVVQARFGEDAVARGAAIRALRAAEAQIFP